MKIKLHALYRKIISLKIFCAVTVTFTTKKTAYFTVEVSTDKNVNLYYINLIEWTWMDSMKHDQCNNQLGNFLHPSSSLFIFNICLLAKNSVQYSTAQNIVTLLPFLASFWLSWSWTSLDTDWMNDISYYKMQTHLSCHASKKQDVILLLWCYPPSFSFHFLLITLHHNGIQNYHNVICMQQ